MAAQATSPRASARTSPNLTPPEDDFNLRDIIRGLGDVESDPYQITALLIETLTPEQKDLALAAALPNYVQRITRPNKTHARIPRVSVSSERWDGVKAIRGELALLRASVFARGEWKFLGDCDRDDCTDLAASRDKRVADTQREADRYRALAATLKKRRKKTVRDLPADVVETIFNA